MLLGVMVATIPAERLRELQGGRGRERGKEGEAERDPIRNLPREEGVGHRGHAHGSTGVTGVGLGDNIGSQAS